MFELADVELASVFEGVHEDLHTLLEAEFVNHYRMKAQEESIPCIDEILDNARQFILFALYHQTNTNRDISVEEFLNSYIHKGTLLEFYGLINNSAERYFTAKQYFFEKDWVFALHPVHYEKELINTPIVNVW